MESAVPSVLALEWSVPVGESKRHNRRFPEVDIPESRIGGAEDHRGAWGNLYSPVIWIIFKHGGQVGATNALDHFAQLLDQLLLQWSVTYELQGNEHLAAPLGRCLPPDPPPHLARWPLGSG